MSYSAGMASSKHVLGQHALKQASTKRKVVYAGSDMIYIHNQPFSNILPCPHMHMRAE